ncbi:hypothetical protein [Ruminiclostridium josui]|uniref:hypothetical protein n=1 Tax=Ruminiclostridium josui TaxID=1499 RepID=UPI0004634B86|nr:hypothetical protein [Ruminiclostridium josui]
MKRKFLVIFILLCFIISSTGCFNKNNQEKVSSYHTKDAKQEQYSLCNEKADLTHVKIGDKDEIVLLRYTIT